MKMASREAGLLGVTLAVAILAGTYWALGPQIKEWKDYGESRRDLEERLDDAEEMLKRQGEIAEKLDEFRGSVPEFAEGKRAESELMPALDRMAQDNGLSLTRRVASDKERVEAGLYETTLTCEWEGGLEGLVKFLYEQQGQGVASDIRVLRVQVASGKEPGKLKGGFEMDCAYRRESRAE